MFDLRISESEDQETRGIEVRHAVRLALRVCRHVILFLLLYAMLAL